LENCSFDRADLDEWRLWKSDVGSCSFQGANLRDSVIGGWRDGRGDRWQNVNFARCDLRDVVADSAIFIDVDFSEARLDKVDCQSCDFVRCRFAGKLREVTF